MRACVCKGWDIPECGAGYDNRIEIEIGLGAPVRELLSIFGSGEV